MMRLRLFALLAALTLLTACQTLKPTMSQEKIAKSAQIHYQLGINALYRGDLPKAFEELMHSNKILPGQAEVLDALAYAWRARGDFVQAEAFYKQSLKADNRPSTHTNYGSLLIALKRYSEAEVHLRLALEDPRYRKQYIALLNLGDALLGQERFTDAIAAYRKAGLLNPNQTISQLKEAEAYVHVNRLNYAQALYEALLDKKPDNRPALEGLIEVLIKLHQLSEAQRYLAGYIEKEKNPLNRAWANDELIRLGHML